MLASGEEFRFHTHDKKGVFAYISSDLSPNIWINLAYPPERLGEAICHEMLHFEDMQRFKPITRINRTGLAADQSKVFQPVIRDLVSRGATLLLTTHYMEEAEQLADDIMVIDHGREIAHGTADELKLLVGGERIAVTLDDREQLAEARRVLERFSIGDVFVDERLREIVVPISGGARTLTEALRALDTEGVGVGDVGLRRPTLDDVFLSLTGHISAGDEPVPAAQDGGAA